MKLAANRPDMLERTLTDLLIKNVASSSFAKSSSSSSSRPSIASSLTSKLLSDYAYKPPSAGYMSVRHARKADVLVLQDGSNAQVAAVAKKYLGVEPTQNPLFSISNLRGADPKLIDGAERIARHYKFSLSAAFRMRPLAPAIIVAEDDFLFSPDFLAYFEAMAPLLERDPSAFVVSAWNDNGLRGKVRDAGRLQRTGFFPGLGWMLSRRLYVDELEASWPKQHWDHWLRDPNQHKGRESIFPEVNRDYHAGRKGTFMDDVSWFIFGVVREPFNPTHGSLLIAFFCGYFEGGRPI